MTVFHLLRHGEPAIFGRLNGRLPGVGLSEKGRAEAAMQAGRLAGEKIEAIYSSPMQRTRETAEILAERLGLPISYREDVIEIDYGEWTGLTFDQIREDERWQLWSHSRSVAAVPGGESWRKVQDRVVFALFDLQRLHPDGSVAIVSHGKAEIRRVRVTRDAGTRLEVDSGVNAGDQVILNPPVDLLSGSPVLIRAETAAAPRG